MVVAKVNVSSSRVGVVEAGTPAPEGIECLKLILIKPSKYDDDGYVMRYLRGVLPSNTLATLAALSEEVVSEGQLGDVMVDTVLMDEHVQKINPRRIARKYQRPGVKLVVALCGVQTNQFPRATDMARQFKKEGVTVIIGGFHVSGAIAMSISGIPPECQELIDEGITLVKGEVEECWGDLLRDALHGQLKTYYDIVIPPQLEEASVPVVDPRLMKRFAYPYMGTIDAGRGCPFECSFCTIINVQGRTMRCRSAEMIKDRIRRNVKSKIDYYFFTDDNFSRNPNWEEIFDAMISLRRDEGIKIHFMIQIDVLAHRLKNFISKAVEAGCTQVFIGMETLNPDNLPASGKRQNRVEDYASMIDQWHADGIACHVGYIIGFPFDTVESVREDVRRLKEEIHVDQVSFFMLTPLPGSMDHHKMQISKEWMDEDYNRFDSFHPTTNHPKMSHDEWFESYRQAWRDFYTVDFMKPILTRVHERTYWGLFKNFLWYKHSAIVEDTHPMICGFFRLKGRKQMREGYKIASVRQYYSRRAREVLHWGWGSLKLFFEMQEVWLATRGRPKIQENLADLKTRYVNLRERLSDSATKAGELVSRQVATVRAGAEEAWQKAGKVSRHAADDIAGHLDQLRQRHGGRMSRRFAWLARLNPFALKIQTRTHLNAYWKKTYRKLASGKIFRINPFGLVYNFVRDVKICTMFSIAFLVSYGK